MQAAGTRFGPYEIVSPLGQGGMGEVYRARDTRLDCTVAIKVLPAGRTHDPQFRERFEREARAVSSLNHPNICVLHDIGTEGGVAYLVMECLEGESLAARLERGALPVAEALRYGVEIAGALDAAHRRGVVHRDLKPGNIMLTKTGAKLLDFGLAKVRAMSAGSGDRTATMTVTTEGSIVGTFQYMSPEQLEGQEADERSDIFAFGATLYEMLTGKRAFTGKSQASLIAAIMSAQPAPVSSVQTGIPAPLDRVVRRCLAKDPDDRWQTARDLGEELRWLAEGGSQEGVARPAAAPRKNRALLTWIVAGLCGAAPLLVEAVLSKQDKHAPPRPMRFSVNAPAGTTLVDGARIAISPDGESILFVAAAEGKQQLYVYSSTNGTTRPLTGAEGGFIRGWSFDSRSFLTQVGGATLYRIDLSGSPPQALQLQFSPSYCSWGPAGVVNASGSELRWFAADGSAARILKSDPKSTFSYASWLPGDRWLIYNKGAQGAGPRSIHALSADGKADRILGTSTGLAIYAAPGYLLLSQGNVLLAQPFDPKRIELRGAPASLADHLGSVSGGSLANFSVSANGVLVLGQGSAGRGGKWQISTRGGEEPQWRADGKELFFVSPDKKIMAVNIAEKDAAIVAGIPHALFSVRVVARNRWVVAGDGKRFLVEELPEPKPVTSFAVILNLAVAA